jgi:hypothetical protein
MIRTMAYPTPRAALFAFTSIIDLRRNLEDETSELLTGNVGLNGLNLLQKKNRAATYTTRRANSPAVAAQCLHLRLQSYFSLWGEILPI